MIIHNTVYTHVCVYVCIYIYIYNYPTLFGGLEGGVAQVVAADRCSMMLRFASEYDLTTLFSSPGQAPHHPFMYSPLGLS